MTHSQVVPTDFICHVVNKVCEESNLEQLVKCDELEVGDTLGTESRRWWPVRQCTMCSILDSDYAIPVWVGKPILEWEVITVR